MDLFYTPSMFWGPIRLFLFFGLVYALNLITSRRKSASIGLDYLVMRYCMFASLLVIAILLLTQMDAYDVLTVLLVLLVALVLHFLDLKRSKSLRKQLAKIKRRSLLYIIQATERRENWISFKNLKKPEAHKKTVDPASKKIIYYQMWVGLMLAVVAYVSRYYYFTYDAYLLGDLWYQDLTYLKDLSLQHWFFNTGSMMGEFAVINFYSDITGITDAVALTSFGFIESSLVTLAIFWSVNKFMGNRIIPGAIAAIVFTGLYAILPMNLDLISQPKSVFLSLTLVLPLMVFLLSDIKPIKKPNRFLATLSLFFTAIFFIDFYISVWVVPLLVTLCALFLWKHEKKRIGLILRAYLGSLVFCFLILGIAALVQGASLSSYLYSNLFNYNSYTFTPQLMLPLDQMKLAYLIGAATFLVLSVLMLSAKKAKAGLLILALLIQVQTLFLYLEPSFIDEDLMLQSICIWIPIMTAGILYCSYTFAVLILKIEVVPALYKAFLGIAVFAGVVYLIPVNGIQSYPKTNTVYGEILNIYDQMNTQLLPLSYALVHNDRNARLNEQNHFFLDYNTFINEYPDKDVRYQTFKDNVSYLEQHPEVVLPQSIYVFTYPSGMTMEGLNRISQKDQEDVERTLDLLKNRGREIKVYLKTKHITVYEIINVPKSSRVADLML